MSMTPKTLASVDPEILEIIQQLRLMDDYFMQVCLQNSVECTELILRIILDKPDLKVQRVTAQKALANLYGHDARLDVFALDSENQPYDIEIQRESRGAQPRRARYYSSLLDANQKDVGSNYEGLPESFVIFITERDVLKGNEPLYKIERQIVGGTQAGRAFGDGAHIIYSERQKDLYFWCGVRPPGAHPRVRSYRYVGYVSHVPVGGRPMDFYRFAEKSAPTAKRPTTVYVTKNYDVYYTSC